MPFKSNLARPISPPIITTEIGNEQITEPKIASGVVTQAKLNPANEISRLAIGSYVGTYSPA